jgi:PAS domain S-box-containing protein
MDIKTIIFCLFIINLFMGLFTFIIKKTQQTYAGINYWIISNLLIGLGYFAMGLRGTLPDYISIVAAQVMFVYAGFLRIFGLNIFFGHQVHTRLRVSAALVIIMLLCFQIIFTYRYDNIFIRTLIDGFLLSLISIYTGILILKNRTSKGRYAYVLTSVTFFIFSAIFIFRIFDWIVITADRGLFISTFFNKLQFLSSMIIDISWTTMFFVIYNQRLNHQLKDNEEKFRAIFKQNSSALALIDFDTRISMVNDAYCQMSGFTIDEVIGKSWTLHIPSGDLERLKEYNMLRIHNPDAAPDKYEFSFYRKDGEIRHGLMSVSVLPSIQLIVASFIDITERKNSELKLQQYATELDHLNRGKDRFISILAHDLKNPFNSLINLSEILLLHFKKFSKEEIEKQLKIIFQTTIATYGLFEDLLLWSACNLGKLQFVSQKVDITNLCREVVANTQITADAKNIAIFMSGPDHIFLLSDENMIKAVLRNLVSNAIKFTNPGGRIDISVQKNHDSATIAVKDNGVGISEKNMQNLWDISRNLTTFGTANEKGTGLGLLLCKELVEKNAGRIWVESEVMKGSSFSFSLPLYIQPA